VGFGRVWRLAAILSNKKRRGSAEVRRRYERLIASLAAHREKLGTLSAAWDHFRKVTRSYRPGLFHCYDVTDLPRTNNELEQFFGSYRYHERRCSGRKVACPGTLVRGSVRLVSAAATRSRSIEVKDLVPSEVSRWRELRGQLERRQAVRSQGRRFRHDPLTYLKMLESSLINQILPP
jgi:hypothetical protein